MNLKVMSIFCFCVISFYVRNAVGTLGSLTWV